MTESRNGLQTPANPGRCSKSPSPISVDERILRALHEDHQTHSHHPNLCPLCLIVAAWLGEPMPLGPYVAPCERALVYMRALHVLGVFDDSDVTVMYEAVRQSRGCTPDGDFGGYMFAANRLRGLLGIDLSSVQKFDDEAYDAIRNAIGHAQASEYIEMLANPQEEYDFSVDTGVRIASAGPDGYPHAEGASVADLEVRNPHAGYPSAEDRDLAAEEQVVAALTAGNGGSRVEAVKVAQDCAYCGPICYGGAAHNARVEDGVFCGPLAGDLPAATPVVRAEVDSPAERLRCIECRRLRSATPKHEATCPRAGENCPGCVYAGEPHLRSCRLSLLFHLPEDECCTGVDVPAIGCVHANDCGNTARRVLRASSACQDAAGLGGAA